MRVEKCGVVAVDGHREGARLGERSHGFAAGDTNLYAYVGGDPVNGVDPSGLFVDTLTDGVAIAGCLFALARDNIYGSCDSLGSNLVSTT